MADSGRSSYPQALRDLFMAGMGAYPAAVNAAVTYWSEMAASASSYYTEVLQGWMAALQNPQEGPVVLNHLAVQLKQHLERSGDIAERTILEFNQRLESILREPATSAPTEPRHSGSSPPPRA